MKKSMVGALCVALWTTIPRLSEAEGFLYLPITRTPVITAAFCGYRTSTGSCHGGTDYDTRDAGDGIFAAAEGVVEAIVDGKPNRFSRTGGYGNSVRIRHPNGYLTIYGHLKLGTLEVGVGDEVRAGQLLGMGDNSGWSTGSHLHFEVRDASGHRVDPYGETPHYPSCGPNSLWVNCPPVSPADVDQDEDGFNMLSDCDDSNPDIHPEVPDDDTLELCNGADEDCDGLTDERWAFLGAACTVEPAPGCIRNGVWVCSSDETTIVCNADSEIRAELCNTFDDDCDGETDEDWHTGLSTDLGQPCEVGLGVCRRFGVWVCEPLGRAVVCNAEYVSGAPEYCDGLDNDCDSYIDDFCLCEIDHPHPNCLCRQCDAHCPGIGSCIVTSVSPLTYSCSWRRGCYTCGGLTPEEVGWVCTRTLSCIEYITAEYCVDPEVEFCDNYCPWPF